MADKKTVAPKKSTTKLPTLEELLQAGSHFGHKTSRWNPKMKQYIYDSRNGVHIIDLIKTMQLLKKAIKALEEVGDEGNILFVGTKGQAASIIENTAKEVGAFYITKRWPGGLFTNFSVIKKSIDRLVRMEEQKADGSEGLVKKEKLMLERDITRQNKIYEGVKFMDKLPKMLVVVDSRLEKIAMKEAKIAGVPVVALLDTNCDPALADFPIPANDDSIKSITLFVELFGRAVGTGKKAAALKALRKNYDAKLLATEATFNAEQERLVAMEEQEKARMKAMRDGKIAKTVRVVEKKKTLKIEKKADKVAKAAKSEKKAVKVTKKAPGASLDTLGLPTRTTNALTVAGIKTSADLTGAKKEDLVAMKGIGDKAADDILKAVK